MAQQAQSGDQPVTEAPDLDALLEAKFGGDEPEQPEQPEQEAAEESAGDDAQAAEESEQEAVETELIEIEVDGEKLPAHPKLKDRFMAHADYTQKTQELANKSRAADLRLQEAHLVAERQAFDAFVAEDKMWLWTMEKHIEQMSANWPNLTSDQRQELLETDRRKNQLAQAIEGKRQEFDAKRAAEVAKLQAESEEAVKKALPAWDTETKASVEKFLIDFGYPEWAVRQMNHLDKQMAYFAWKHKQLQSQAKPLVKKAAEAPVIAPTARKTQMPKDVRAKLDLKNAVKAGKRDSIESALDKRLDQLFGG